MCVWEGQGGGGGAVSSSTNYSNNTFQFPARRTMISYYPLIFSCFFSFFSGQPNKISFFEQDIPVLTLQVHVYDKININSSIATSMHAYINTAGKLSYNMPITEGMELYFTDDWGDIITDLFWFHFTRTFPWDRRYWES